MRVSLGNPSCDGFGNIILLYNTKRDPNVVRIDPKWRGRMNIRWLCTTVPSSLCEIGLTPESCGSCWSAQTDQQVDHGSKEADAPSLVQSRQWNGDEIKEGTDS